MGGRLYIKSTPLKNLAQRQDNERFVEMLISYLFGRVPTVATKDGH